MTDNKLTPAEQLYHGIASLRGWDEALGQAQRWADAYTSRVGRVLSAVLLAGGEDRVPVAIAGNLDDHGTGSLAVLHDDVLVLVSAEALTAKGGTVTVSLHAISAIERVEVVAHHSHYYGTDDYPRHSNMEVHVGVGGREVTFPGRTYSATALTDDAAAAAALTLIRQHLGSRRGDQSRVEE